MGAWAFLHKFQGPRSQIRGPPGRRSPARRVRDQCPSSRLHSAGNQRGISSDARMRIRSDVVPQHSAVHSGSLRDSPQHSPSACLLRWAFRSTRGRGSDAEPSTQQGRPSACQPGRGKQPWALPLPAGTGSPDASGLTR
ncbi:hypothetical protein NDU88_002886 [Pleurodeles waltl]|uniref:Uncharacterized protein n=1 Tax=Pleurodeles waltl TaxID=8319 RepID=A0AAV7UZU0_PLEWA|nr:hypothetical protein NDU88_002886 [Pleurodeles waltl]